MTLDSFRNFGNMDVSTGYNDTVTSIVVSAGHGTRVPETGSYNAAWYNSTDYADISDAFRAGEAEIIRMVGSTSDTKSITRAQEGTVAVTHNTGGKTYKIIQPLTQKTIADIETDIAAGGGDFSDGGDTATTGRVIGNTTSHPLTIVTNDTTGIIVSASTQIIAMPKQSGCSVYMSSPQSLPAGILTILNFNIKKYDIQNEFNTTNNRFTATEAGNYLIILAVMIGSTFTSGRSVANHIYVNGSRKSEYTVVMDGSSQGYLVTSRIHALSANDYIEGRMTQNDTVSRALNSTDYVTYMTIVKVT